MAKKRLDVLLVEQGLAESRQKAQAIIMAGQVYAGERRCDKAGQGMDEGTVLEVRGQALPYTTPNTVSTMPTALLSVFALALFAKRAAILAHSNVNTMQRIRHHKSGAPPIAK